MIKWLVLGQGGLTFDANDEEEGFKLQDLGQRVEAETRDEAAAIFFKDKLGYYYDAYYFVPIHPDFASVYGPEYKEGEEDETI